MDERKVAVISGGATGVGAACAEWFAQRGYHVLVNYRSSAADAEKVAEHCRSIGVQAFCVQGDVAQEADCRVVAKAASDAWGRVDVLVNSAGTTVFRALDDLDALDGADFHRLFGVNVIGAYQMTRAVRGLMMPHGGAVVNVSSIAGASGTGSSHAYAASKGALNTLTLSLARTLAPAIRVNAVLPGMIQGRWLRDGIGEEAYERVRQRFGEDAALGIVATPRQVAEAIGYLACDAELVTGQLVNIDAGLGLGRPPKVER